KEIMEELGYSPSSFADTIDVPRPIISHILSGRNKPSLDVIQKILMRFSELNPWWLLTGTGTMKQLNLFSDQELEAITIKNTAIQQSSTTAQPVKAAAPVSESSLKNSVPEEKASAPVSASVPTATSTPPKTEPIKTVSSDFPIQPFQTGKTVEKMIVFYTDKTFAVYHPE
ncbi:MAG TPA: helix-turn-helix transcriptional regulator, partial [Cytophagaceae bacterium]|nr:helix-turn-helix transcriptional regulator [Cytophagaceae bacterium]